MGQRKRLIARRKELTKSQARLASDAGVTTRSIIRWEAGAEIRLDVRPKYAAGLEWPMATFNAALEADDGLALNGHVVRKRHRLFASLEQGATVLRTYQPVSIPGLLQTAAYATKVESVWPVGADPHDVTRRVEHRLHRQLVLDRLRLFALIDASVLRRDTGGPDVMAAQIAHLAALAERPNLDIRVVPLDHRGHAAGTGSFTIFTGEDEDSPYMVATENLVGPNYHEDPTMVTAYVTLFDHLWRESDEVAEIHL